MGFQTEGLEEEIEVLKEANVQLADKIKLLSAQKENAELKLKSVLGTYRKIKEEAKVLQKSLTSSLQIQAGQGYYVTDLSDKLEDEMEQMIISNIKMKEALEYYADEEHCNANYPMEVARKVLEKL